MPVLPLWLLSAIPSAIAVLEFDPCLFLVQPFKLQLMEILEEQFILGRFSALFLNWEKRINLGTAVCLLHPS